MSVERDISRPNAHSPLFSRAFGCIRAVSPSGLGALIILRECPARNREHGLGHWKDVAAFRKHLSSACERYAITSTPTDLKVLTVSRAS